MTVCDGVLPFESIECPREFDNPSQTSCCPDFQGCCYPGVDKEYLLVDSDVNPAVHYVFTSITVVILLFAIIFLCCDSSEPSTKNDDEFLLVAHDSRPILFRTITGDEERDRTLRILTDRGELQSIAPSVDRRIKDQTYSPCLSTLGESQPRMNYGTRDVTEELPPPYTDLLPFVLERNGEMMTSDVAPSRYGDTYPESTYQRPPPFAP